MREQGRREHFGDFPDFPLNRTGGRVPFFFLFPLYMNAERRPERGSCLPRGSSCAAQWRQLNEGFANCDVIATAPGSVNHKDTRR